MTFHGKGRPMTEAGMAAALEHLGLDPVVDLPVLWAVLLVESRGFGFLPDRRPKILFERHVFHKETGGRFAQAAPDLCDPRGGGYQGGAAEFDRLTRALNLCRTAGLGEEPALRSASWGMGQVMGFNCTHCRFDTATDMVGAMAEGEDAQLLAMACFITHNRLDARLRARDWTGFARGYNGPGFWKNQYDLKLAEAHARFSSGVTRDVRARAAQGALLYLGYNPGEPDGLVGQNTRRAVAAFRRDAGLPAGDALTEATHTALMERAGLA
jgi:hypothetical protein